MKLLFKSIVRLQLWGKVFLYHWLYNKHSSQIGCNGMSIQERCMHCWVGKFSISSYCRGEGEERASQKIRPAEWEPLPKPIAYTKLRELRVSGSAYIIKSWASNTAVYYHMKQLSDAAPVTVSISSCDLQPRYRSGIHLCSSFTALSRFYKETA